MTTELEVASTGNYHRHFDDIISCSSMLGNGAHFYTNSSFQALLTSDLMQDNGSLPSALHDLKLPSDSHYHHHHLNNMMHLPTAALELEGNCAFDNFTRHNCINVDSVPSNYYLSQFNKPNTVSCNINYNSIYEHEGMMQLHLDFLGGSRDGFFDKHEPACISRATNLPFNIDTKPHQPHVHVNSFLVDDIMMNDNSIIPCFLTSSNPQSFNPVVDNAQPLSPLDLNDTQGKAKFSKHQSNINQSRHQASEVQKVLCVKLPGTQQPSTMAPQALFEDGQFLDEFFVSTLFNSNSMNIESKEESDEYNIHGSMSGSVQRYSCRGQKGDKMLSSPFESSEVHNEIDKGAMKGCDASPSSSYLVDNTTGHFMHQPKHSSNKDIKRALVEGDHEGPPRKRLLGLTSPARSNDVGAHDEQDQSENNVTAPTTHKTTNKITNTNYNNNFDNETKNKITNTNYNNIFDNEKNKSSEKKIALSASSSDKVVRRGGNKQPTACDPQSVAARHRRERISERLKILQELVPNGSKVDIVTMLEKAISYVKFLQLQVKVLTTDEYWPNSQKLNQPNEINLLNLFMSKTPFNDSSNDKKNDKVTENTSKA